MDADQIIALLDQLASRLEGPAKYVFDLAVRQTLISGAMSLVVGVILLVVVAFIYRKAKSFAKTNPRESVEVWMVGGTAMVVVSIFGLISMSSAINSLLNPEYQTLINLVHLVVK